MHPEQQEDLPSMPPERQMAAMGLIPQTELATGTEGRQEDLPSMPPEKQMEAMGLAPLPAASTGADSEQEEPEPRAGATTLEPEMQAYRAARQGEASSNTGL
jgi:hypothetical protein